MTWDPFAPDRRLVRGASLALLACCLGACGHDWAAYDPRLGAGASGGSASTSGTGAAGSSGASGSSSSSGGSSGSGAGASSSSSGTSSSGGSAGSTGSTGGSGPGPVPCGADGIANVSETFDDGVIGPGWKAAQKLGASIAESNGELAVSIPAGSLANAYAYLSTAEPYDLSSCQVFVKVTQVPVGANAYVQLWVDPGNGDKLEIVEWGGDLELRETVANSLTVVKTLPYSPVKHVFWRIRAGGGNVYWETSADGKVWSIAASKPSMVALSDVYFGVGAGDIAAEAVSRTAHFDDFNVVP